MADIKLGRLPDRTPVKLTIHILPDLQRSLLDYAQHYAEAYGREEPITDLVPAMLAAFLASDPSFLKRTRGKSNGSI